MRLSIARRLGLFVVLVVILTTAVLSGVTAWSIRESTLPVEAERLHADTVGLAAQLEASVRDTREDLQIARDAAPVEAVLGPLTDETEAARARTEDLFTAMLSAKPDYLQLRVIDASGAGREVVRVERSGAGEPVFTTPQDALQDKGHRSYVREALEAPPGTIVISPIELNRERDVVQEPHVPVVRASLAVRDETGLPIGVVVLNVDMRPTLERLQLHSNDGTNVYLIDASAEFVGHPTPGAAFAHSLRGGPRFVDTYPQLADLMRETASTSRRFDGEDGQHLIVWIPITLAGRQVFVAAETVSTTQVATEAAVRSILLVALPLILLTAALAFLVARTVTGPLGAMTRAVQTLPGPGLDSLPTDDGSEVGVLARSFREMYALNEAQNSALAAQQRLVAVMVDRSPAAMLIVSADHRVAKANPAARSLLDPDGAGLVGRDIRDVVPEEPGGEAPEWKVVRTDGSSLDMHVDRTLVDVDGDRATLWTLSDVSEAVRARNKLLELIDALPIAVLAIDDDDVIRLANRQAQKLFGLPREALLASRPTDLYTLEPDAEPSSHDRATLSAFRSGRALPQDGHDVLIESSSARLHTETGVIHLRSFIDCTVRKQAEADLRRSNQELEQFAYIASHDLQEPLRMVANYTELLAERYEGQLDERADQYIHFATDGARRMQRLVKDLLLYSRVESRGRAFEPVDAGEVLDAVVHSLQTRLAETGGTVRYDDLPMVWGDETQLHQLFQNLVGNALKFHSDEPPVVHIRARRDGARWQFTVTDNGIGIEPRFAGRIFQMFKRLHPTGTYDGSGIGLAVAKRIVDRHGGTIHFKPAELKGTTFTFTLSPIPRRAGARLRDENLSIDLESMKQHGDNRRTNV